MSTSLKLSSVFKKSSWYVFLLLVLVSIAVFISSIITYSNWEKLEVPDNTDCQVGLSRNFDSFSVNEIERGSMKNTSGFIDTQNEQGKNKRYTLSYNVASQDSPFVIVVEVSQDTKTWIPISETIIKSKTGLNSIDFITSSSYLRLNLVTGGKNVVVTSMRIKENVNEQKNEKESVRKTMFGSLLTSTVLMTFIIVSLFIIFVDIRGIYEYLINEQTKLKEK